MKVIRLNPFGGGNVLTEIEIEELASGQAYLLTLHPVNQRPRCLQLDEAQLKLFETAKEKGFCSAHKNKDRVCVLVHRWLESHKQPNVRIEKRGRYAKIVADLIMVSEVRRIAWASLEQHPPTEIGGQSRYWGTLTHIEKIPLEHAEKCAEWLVALYRSITHANNA